MPDPRLLDAHDEVSVAAFQQLVGMLTSPVLPNSPFSPLPLSIPLWSASGTRYSCR
jgi:hypothetical protein